MKMNELLERNKTLYVISSLEDRYSPALTKPAGKDEYCITVSEDINLVTFKNWHPRPVGAKDLIMEIPDNVGLVFVFQNSGRYVSSKELKNIKTDMRGL